MLLSDWGGFFFPHEVGETVGYEKKSLLVSDELLRLLSGLRILLAHG